MYQEFQGVEITAITGCVPKERIGNDAFDNIFSQKERRFFEKTVGIFERRWAPEDITASDLGFLAATRLMENLPVNKLEIDCLIFLSQTPDYKIPFTSNILQGRLGLKSSILCLDINAGCAGFIQGLSTSFAIAKTLNKGKVLFVIAETLSKILSKKDRSTSPLFGDGAAAILVENTEDSSSKAYFNFFSDGANANAIEIPDGGYRSPVSVDSLKEIEDSQGNISNRLHLSMNGPKVFDFTLREIVPSIKELYQKSGIDDDKINYYLLHQSNQFILKQIASKLDVSSDKMLLNIKDFGNTSGVSIPLLMCSNFEKLSKSGQVLLSGYGSGLNWGNCIVDISKTNISSIIED